MKKFILAGIPDKTSDLYSTLQLGSQICICYRINVGMASLTLIKIIIFAVIIIFLNSYM